MPEPIGPPQRRAGRETVSLLDVLQERAARRANHTAYIFLRDGETDQVSLTYEELDRAARRIAAILQPYVSRGDRVLLLYPAGLEFIAAFFGCLYAGIVSVPLYPPRPNRTMQRLERVIADCGARLALTVERTLSDLAAAWGDNALLSSVEYLPTDATDAGDADGFRPEAIHSRDLAYLQYTSGSTSAPRGVMVTHRNLSYNCAYMQEAFSLSPETRSVTWLPHFHDMGLIEGLLNPVFTGFPAVIMSPAHFVQKPIRWLQAISRSRATHSGAPNFAYDLCARKVTPEQALELDLSSWTVAYSGAEPVRAETLNRFADFFAPSGFRRESLYPCYGLAEATLMVSGGTKSAGPVLEHVDAAEYERGSLRPVSGRSGKSRTIVGCGRARRETGIAIVDPHTGTPSPPDTVGEIWVSGPTVAAGYWQQPDSDDTFRARLDGEAGVFLRTGDLGVLRGNELFITGRLKDLIIIRGGNVYPQDIEWVAENAHAGLRKGFGAAFSIDQDSGEQLVVAHEVDREYRRVPEAELEHMAQAIRERVSAEFELTVMSVVLLAFGSIHKTSSGKIQRQSCRHDYLEGRLDILWESKLPPTGAASPNRPAEKLDRSILMSARPADRRRILEHFLCGKISELLEVERQSLDSKRPLGAYGLDSLRGNELVHRLQQELAIPLSNTLVWNHPTIADVAMHIAEKMNIVLDMGQRPSVSSPAEPASQGVDGQGSRGSEDALSELLTRVARRENS